MSLIEGFGDEVTIFFIILLAFLILCLAWFSTNIRDIPFFSVIIIELTHRRNRGLNNTDQPTESHSQNQTESTGAESQQEREVTDITSNESTDSPLEASSVINSEDKNLPAEEVKASDSEKNHQHEESDGTENKTETTGDSNSSADDSGSGYVSENVVISESVTPITETELRQRRLNFFQGKKSDGETVSQETLRDVESLKKSESSEQQTQENTARRVEKESKENVMSNQEVDSETGLITVKLKYLNETQRIVMAAPNVTIGQFRRDNFATELSQNKLVRFIFNGQDLRNDASTLQNYNIGDNSVVHCLITQVNQEAPPPRADNEHGFDIGMIMLPAFGLIICLVWYLRFEYKQFFTATSTFSLIGVTFLFIAAVLASWETQRFREPIPDEHIE